jgi:ABC-type Fe3+ transport system substrate-binding protein
VVVTVAYGTEKEQWLKAAVERFAATNPRVSGRPVQIVLEGKGSREIVTDIVQSGYQPTVVSPASSVQIALLRDQWAKKSNGASIFFTGTDAPQPLVLTPLVLVAWKARGDVLWPNGAQNFWQNLHTVLAAKDGYASLGHPEWGFVKLGHTSPELSNSGIQALMLLAYGYNNTSSGLTSADVLNDGFRSWLGEIERAVPQFGESTGLLMTDMLRFGPSKYDMVIVYESLAIENIQVAQGRGGDIHVYYPPATVYSDHPYAVLDAPWVSPEQRQAAGLFRDFLLGTDMQTLAMNQFGFRPANLSVPINLSDPNNPFTRYASYGITYDVAQQVEVPPGDVLDTLIELWRRDMKR